MLKVQQSASDDRAYRYFRLESNELQVLVISDPSTDKSAAALDVKVGSYSDELAGEAHFLEHMLFMGTSKYPNENDYNIYLNQNGGSSNAYTDLEHTNYHLDVLPGSLDGAMDRLAQFFIEPLMKEEALDRERQAVDSEHAKNLQSDMWRTYQLTKSLASSDHPYSKFGTGNANSLAKVNQQTIKAFYEKHYSANRMALVVLGQESLDELQSMVQKHFMDIPNRSLPMSQFPGSPFANTLPLQLDVVRVQQDICLELEFPMREVQSLYHFKPTHYISHLLGHESGGSLLALLRKENYAHELSAGLNRSQSDWSNFSISIMLTELGFENWKTVVEWVFSYLKMMRDEKPQEWIYNEAATVAECSFRFLSKQNPISYTSSLATNLHLHAPEHVMSGDYLYFDYQPESVEDCLKYLVPENLLAVLSHPTAFEGKTTQTEPWYDVKYNANPVDTLPLGQWSNPEKKTELHLPERNDMIATNFDLKEHESKSDTPILLEDSPILRLWYKPDTVFNMPKTNMLLEFQSIVAYQSPESIVLLSLWQLALAERANDFTYLASMAGLYCDFVITKTGLELHVSGYNDKLDKLLERIVQVIKSNELDDDVFYRLKDKLKQQFLNFPFLEPYQHAMYGGDLCMLDQKFTIQEKIEALKDITSKDVLHFGLNQFLKRFRLECLVHGNSSIEDAKRLTNVVIDSIKPKAPFALSEERVVQLTTSKRYVYRLDSFNPSNTNSVVERIYQMGPLTLLQNAHLALMNNILKEPAFNELRTQQQLGYIVHTSINTFGNNHNVKGYLILIQSDSYSPKVLEERIDTFFHETSRDILKLDKETFDQQVAAVCQTLREKPKNLLQESSRYWGSISKRNYNFTRMKDIANLLEKEVTPDSLLNFYEKYIMESPRLSVQVHGNNHDIPTLENTNDTDVLIIENPTEFKRTMPLFPLKPTAQFQKES
mmetsp:Transcript_40178/g.45725  ORF Transcript_40178/g.45725 Transcript_40178/m.45725 type:complete len:944 (+) Transcript_40178:191-3022(+)